MQIGACVATARCGEHPAGLNSMVGPYCALYELSDESTASLSALFPRKKLAPHSEYPFAVAVAIMMGIDQVGLGIVILLGRSCAEAR